MALTTAALFSVGGLIWIGRDLVVSPVSPVGRPSLLELLEEVGTPGGGRIPSRPAPPPPANVAWRSPMETSCPRLDPRLRQRLELGRKGLQQRTFHVRIHPSNFGQRFHRDAFGNRVDPSPRVIVLHETVYGLRSALNTFLTPHANDEDQVSYHLLIGQNGEVVQALDPSRRAFGAGYSAFNGQWVVSNPAVGGSINNFALHLSLETPIDGDDEDPGHSGYTEQQYDAMALVLADWMERFRIPAASITTHRHVDLGGERADPRSFDWARLQQRLAALGVLC
jgi:N-acetylmuramoyl-L-alanine amidase